MATAHEMASAEHAHESATTFRRLCVYKLAETLHMVIKPLPVIDPSIQPLEFATAFFKVFRPLSVVDANVDGD